MARFNCHKLDFGNRPFYSCGRVTRPMNGSEAAGDLVLIQTSLLFLCKCRLVSIATNIDYFMVGERVRFLFTSCEESQTNE